MPGNKWSQQYSSIWDELLCAMRKVRTHRNQGGKTNKVGATAGDQGDGSQWDFSAAMQK